MVKRGFTLLEVVLAIGLAGAILGLLATAIDSYLVHVDNSRTQVESAQLARTLLQQIANDIQAARYDSPSAGSSAGSEDSSGAEVSDSTPVQGIFGTAQELRIDRSSVWQWQRQVRLTDITSQNSSFEDEIEPDSASMPQTVRYLLVDGKELLAAKLAAAGVSEDLSAPSYAGLYREQVPTAHWLSERADSYGSLGNGEVETAELIAPEVVDITFAYFDGEQLLDEWDSSLEEELPKAIEIKITLLEEPFEQASARTADARKELRDNEENLVEYRRVVKLPDLREPYASGNVPGPNQQ